ncbi:MAG: PQQ-dependent sugar dehydrogenase [Pseudomonadota bacterium]
MKTTTLILQCACVLALSFAHGADRQTGAREAPLVFAENCAVCHGDQLEGAPQGTPLKGKPLMYGEDLPSLISSIANGAPEKGMPAWSNVFNAEEIKSLALWVSEVRDGLTYETFNYLHQITYPKQAVKTQQTDYYLYPVIQGLDRLPYSIAPLPDGSILLTEKMRGLRLISPDGEKSDLITGTPAVYDQTYVSDIGLEYGSGWLLDVAIHPDYKENGWVYLHHTDRCDNCNAASRAAKRPASMNRLIRGRIKNRVWVDEEVIWQADLSAYTPSSDVAAGGRLAFDPDGFVFMSTGMKSRDGIQDLNNPHGKILRLHDDGRIPTDNPFVNVEGALPEIWSYGHRSPQGLEFNKQTGQLWGTEHGPRGGDEINLLLPGRNYGWPLFSKGQNYDGSEVAWGRKTSEVELKDIEQPIVDMTPSPAISSFVIYEADAFPSWQGQMIVGSLKAMDIFRINIKYQQASIAVDQEMIVEDLARIRDIEVADNGDILLLLEHNEGGQIARLTPRSQRLSNPKKFVGRVLKK